MSLREFFNVDPIVFFILGFSVFFFAVYVCIMLSIALGAIVISIAIALIACGISKNSSIMTGKIVSCNIYESFGELEDRRLTIREKFAIIQAKLNLPNYPNSSDFLADISSYLIYYQYSIWKCKTYVDRAWIFREYFKKNEEEKLIHFIDCLFQDLCEGKEAFNPPLLHISYIRHLNDMYNKLLTLDRFNHRTSSEQKRRYRILNNLRYLKGYSTTPIYF